METQRIMTKPWYMTDREIDMSYRQARDRDNQVHIIADLNVQDVQAVCDKLTTLGFDMSDYMRRRIQPKINSWTDEDIKLMIRLRDVYKMSFAKIAVALDRTEGSVKNKYQRMTGVYL